MSEKPEKISKQIPSVHSFCNKLVRFLWGFAWLFLFRPTPNCLHGWRRFLLRLFGAKIGKAVHVYPRARFWLPANLEMNDGSCIANDVDCYNVALITIGCDSTVSQYTYLCAATHDITKLNMPLVAAPIRIEDQAWVTAGVFIGLGVTIGQGSVVGARAVVTKDVPPWTVVAGNPAKVIKERNIAGSDPCNCS